MIDRPNFVVIYCDDLGWGDVGCYDARSRIPTPHIDALAAQGMRFTDAHSPSSICSPSRYALMTGRYAWRTDRKAGNPAPGEQPWISPDRWTLASMFKHLGYDTAAVAKWGLGSDWQSAAKPGRQGRDISADAIDYCQPVHSGRCIGFDYDDVHLWYANKYHETVYPCGRVPGAVEKIDGGRWFFENGMAYGGEPQFERFDMASAQIHYTRRACDYIDAKAGRVHRPQYHTHDGAPFFLFYAPAMPHWPHTPTARFRGSTPLGYYGDYVAQLDWAVGQVVEALERNGLRDNTMVLLSTDHGAERQGYDLVAQHGHFSMGPWRGLKRDLWEGGHRAPFIISWPDRVPQGVVSERLICHTDLFATLAQFCGFDYPDDAGEDSYSFLDELIESYAVAHRRTSVIHHSCTGQLALRDGDWVYIDNPSGDDHLGRGENRRMQEPQWFRDMRGVTPHEQPYELFNLAEDPQELHNRHADEPQLAAAMKQRLDAQVAAGRTAPAGVTLQGEPGEG